MLLLVGWAFSLTVIYALLYTRRMPTVLIRGWFAATVIFNMVLMSWLLTLIADSLRHIGVSRKYTQLLCTVACRFTFGQVLFWNPQVRLHINESKARWAAIPPGAIVAINHVSFWDVIEYVGASPLTHVYNCRTLMKSSLRKIPLFGSIFDRIGHFPVYFRSDAEGNFSVDKEKQELVMRDVYQHLRDGGRLSFFPEGAVNKNPAVLAPFRHGSFNVILDLNTPLYFMVTRGHETVWPSALAVGGFPADVSIVIEPFAVLPDDTPVTLSTRLRETMQARLDELRAKVA